MKLVDKLTPFVSAVYEKAVENAPVIAIGSGIVIGVIATVKIAVDTYTLKEELEPFSEDAEVLEKIEEKISEGEEIKDNEGKPYTIEQVKKNRWVLRRRLIMTLIKKYGLGFVLYILSMILIIGGTKELKLRNSLLVDTVAGLTAQLIAQEEAMTEEEKERIVWGSDSVDYVPDDRSPEPVGYPVIDGRKMGIRDILVDEESALWEPGMSGALLRDTVTNNIWASCSVALNRLDSHHIMRVSDLEEALYIPDKYRKEEKNFIGFRKSKPEKQNPKLHCYESPEIYVKECHKIVTKTDEDGDAYTVTQPVFVVTCANAMPLYETKELEVFNV